jgi:hypothetical protein
MAHIPRWLSRDSPVTPSHPHSVAVS